MHLYKLPHSLKLSVKQKMFYFFPIYNPGTTNKRFLHGMNVYFLSCVCALQILRGVTIPLFLNGRRSAFRITGSMCYCWTFAWQTDGAVPGRIRCFFVVLSLMCYVSPQHTRCKHPVHETGWDRHRAIEYYVMEFMIVVYLGFIFRLILCFFV